MKILDTIGTACKKVVSFVKEAKEKALALIVGAGATVGATSAKAAAGITLVEGTGFTGSIDTIYYMSAVSLVVSFLAIALAIGYGIRALRKG